MARESDEVKATYDASKAQRLARLKKYRSQLDKSKNWRRDGFDDTWRELIDLYKNKTCEEGEKTDYDDSVSLAIGFSTINVIYPSVSLNRPKVTLTANRPDMVEASKIAEAVVNYWWKHYEYQAEFRKAVKDFLVIGHGWVKTTYRLVEEDQEMSDDEYRDELAKLLEEKYSALAMRPQDANLFPEDHQIAETLPTVRKVVLEDHPVVERVSPFDIFIDPDATSLADLRWICQRIAIPKAEAREIKDWNKAIQKELLSSAGQLHASDGYYTDQVDPEETFVVIYEHYDLTTGYLCTFADTGEDFLKPPEKVPFPFEHPFTLIENYEVPEQFYAIGELEMIEPLIEAESKILSRQLGDVAQFTRKYGTKEAWVDTKAINSLKSTADGEIIFFDDNAPDDLRQVLVPLPTMSPNPEMYQMYDVLGDAVTRVSAVNEYQQGVQPEVRRTATEAGIIADASNARAAEKLAQIEQAIARIARKVIQLGQTFLTGEQIAAIFQEDPNEQTTWVEFTREQIRGEFAFDVEAGSTQPRNETFRRQSALQMMDAFSNPLFQPQQQPDGTIAPVIDARKLAIYVMKEGFGVKNASEFIVEAPPPMPMMPPGMEGMLPPGAEGPGGAVPPPGTVPAPTPGTPPPLNGPPVS